MDVGKIKVNGTIGWAEVEGVALTKQKPIDGLGS